jgi:hypothetical protein
MKPTHDSLMILALKRTIMATFNHDKWIELGYTIGLEDRINNHPRLLRSLSWNDSDYSECVVNFLEDAATSPGMLKNIIDFVNPKQWLENNDQELFSKLFGGEALPLKEIEDKLIFWIFQN